jgi:hypothetical protein
VNPLTALQFPSRSPASSGGGEFDRIKNDLTVLARATPYIGPVAPSGADLIAWQTVWWDTSLASHPPLNKLWNGTAWVVVVGGRVVSARVHRQTGTQSIPSGGSKIAVGQLIVYDTPDWNDDGLYSTGSGNSIWTVPWDGYWDIRGMAPFDGVNTIGLREIGIIRGWVAGVGDILHKSNVRGGSTNIQYVQLSYMARLLAGDTIALYAWQDSGGAINLLPGATDTPGPWASVTYAGPF